MLLRNAMEPLARLVPHVLRYYGCNLGKAWQDFRNDLPHGDLIPQKQTKDDEVGYYWHKNGGAHIWIRNIRYLPVDPAECDMKDRIILSSKLKARENLPFSNPTSEVQKSTISHTTAKGGNEVKAITAGFEKKTTVSAKVSGGVKGLADAKASVVDETTIRAGYENTTGRTYESATARGYELNQPPYTAGEGRLTWSEQTCQTRVKGIQNIDCEIEIYYWRSYKKYDFGKARKTRRHKKSNTVVFKSAQLLIALLEGRGSVHTPFFELFIGHDVAQRHIDDLKALLVQEVDFLTEPYSEDSEFKTEIVNLVQLPQPGDDEE